MAETDVNKWGISILSGLIFMLVSSPFLYQFVNFITSPFGLDAAVNGCPTFFGLFINTIIFILIVRAVMGW